MLIIYHYLQVTDKDNKPVWPALYSSIHHQYTIINLVSEVSEVGYGSSWSIVCTMFGYPHSPAGCRCPTPPLPHTCGQKPWGTPPHGPHQWSGTFLGKSRSCGHQSDQPLRMQFGPNLSHHWMSQYNWNMPGLILIVWKWFSYIGTIYVYKSKWESSTLKHSFISRWLYSPI